MVYNGEVNVCLCSAETQRRIYVFLTPVPSPTPTLYVVLSIFNFLMGSHMSQKSHNAGTFTCLDEIKEKKCVQLS